MTIVRHVQGNYAQIAIPLTKRVRTLMDGVEKTLEEEFIPHPSFPVYVMLSSSIVSYKLKAVMDGNIAIAELSDELKSASYNVTVKCHDGDGRAMRYMARGVLKVVDATADAGIDAGVEFNACTHTLDGAVFLYAKGQKGDSYIITEDDYQSNCRHCYRKPNG